MPQFGPTGACKLPEVRKEINPDSRDIYRDLLEVHIQKTGEYLQEHFPHIDHQEPAIVESCIYTVCIVLITRSVNGWDNLTCLK